MTDAAQPLMNTPTPSQFPIDGAQQNVASSDSRGANDVYSTQDTTALANPSTTVGGDSSNATTSLPDDIWQLYIDDTVGDDSTSMATPQVVGGVVGDKEHEPLAVAEVQPLTEFQEEEAIPEEVEGWLEHLKQEKDIHLPQPITDDTGQVMMQNAAPVVKAETIVLPLTQAEIEAGLHHKVMDSARWLAEWCVRIAKSVGGKVTFRQ